MSITARTCVSSVQIQKYSQMRNPTVHIAFNFFWYQHTLLSCIYLLMSFLFISRYSQQQDRVSICTADLNPWYCLSSGVMKVLISAATVCSRPLYQPSRTVVTVQWLQDGLETLWDTVQGDLLHMSQHYTDNWWHSVYLDAVHKRSDNCLDNFKVSNRYWWVQCVTVHDLCFYKVIYL